MPMRNVKNYLEDLVKEIAREEIEKDPGMCKCETCFLDVVAYSLNRLEPMYAATDMGHAVTGVKLSLPQMRAKVLAVVLEAIKKVKENPRH